MANHGCCADKACNDKTCMELPTGTTCGDCGHFRHCAAFYAHKATDTYCDFFPRRFRELAPAPAGVETVDGGQQREVTAREIYEGWRDEKGWVPWVEGGNSLMQDKARREAAPGVPVAHPTQPEQPR